MLLSQWVLTRPHCGLVSCQCVERLTDYDPTYLAAHNPSEPAASPVQCLSAWLQSHRNQNLSASDSTWLTHLSLQHNCTTFNNLHKYVRDVNVIVFIVLYWTNKLIMMMMMYEDYMSYATIRPQYTSLKCTKNALIRHKLPVGPDALNADAPDAFYQHPPYLVWLHFTEWLATRRPCG